MNETVVSMNGIINQMQYYGEEFVRYHITDSIITIIFGLVFLIITTVGLWLTFKFEKEYEPDKSMFCIIGSMITGTVSIVTLIIGWYNYIIWKTVPVGAAIQQILDMGE